MYRVTYRLKNKDVNLRRQLRTSRLMEMLQEACIAHTEELGAGRDKTLDQGLLWVVIMQQITIQKMPEYDDEIILETWPGETMHVLFPRFFRVADKGTNEVCITGSSLWTLISSDTRKMVFADRYGIAIHGEKGPVSIDLPKSLSKEDTNQSCLFHVPFSYCDLNDHMNNTHYYDLAENILNYAKKGAKLHSVTAEYISEAKFNEPIQLNWNENNTHAYMEGIGKKPCFRMSFEYFFA